MNEIMHKERRIVCKKEMSILVISYYYNLHNTNSLCLEPVLDHLVKNGYNVHVLCCHNVYSNKRERINEHRMPSGLLNIKNMLERNMKKNVFFKTIGLAFQYCAFLLSFEKIYEKIFLSAKMINYTKKIIEVEKVTHILSISHPIINHQLALQLKKEQNDLRWAMYQFDPYTFNYGMSKAEQPVRRNIEQNLLTFADKIILTEGIWEENKRMCLGNEFEDKTLSIPLPNLVLMQNSKKRRTKCFDVSKINLMFAGNIYSNIRKPDILLDIMSKLSDPDIYLHIYGWGMEKIIERYPNLTGQIHLHGNVPKQDVIIAMNEASVLINFGNSMYNQTPSKIFDYISVGKPIVNFGFSENDTSFFYLKRYPLFLNILNDEALSDSVISNFVEFCRLHKNSVVNNDEIAVLYHDMLSENVCDRIETFLVS